jgi:hypothetical protein
VKFSELKQKIKDNRLRIGAVCGALAGIIGMCAAEYYRREYYKLIMVDPDDSWGSIEVPKILLEDVENGETMTYRKIDEDHYEWRGSSDVFERYVEN